MQKPSKPLYQEPVQLNVQLHRHKKLAAFKDHSVLSASHAVYINAVEFVNAAQHFPIVFVPATVANPQITPIAMMALVPNDNLFVEGSGWDSSVYLPAFFRRLPYLTAPLPNSDQIAVYIDAKWPALNDTDGEPLFTAEGEHAPALVKAIDFLKLFDEESQRTAQLCSRLQALELLTTMEAEMKLPDGDHIKLDGFMVVDEDKLRALPDAAVLELHRSGALGLVHAHLLSLDNLNRLVLRHARRGAGQESGSGTTAAND